MVYNFLGCDRDQPFLLPPDLRDWLPEGHLAWFVLDAADQANRTHDKLEAEVAEILRQAAEIDQREDRLFEHARGDELHPELASKADRLARLRQAKAQLEAEATANVTDPDSRLLHTRNATVQDYNAQAVTTLEQVIVAAELTREANDVHQLKPMLQATATTLAAAGIGQGPKAALADSGY